MAGYDVWPRLCLFPQSTAVALCLRGKSPFRGQQEKEVKGLKSRTFFFTSFLRQVATADETRCVALR